VNPEFFVCDAPLERELPVDENEQRARWVELAHERDEADDE
jgi:hypothetical protein